MFFFFVVRSLVFRKGNTDETDLTDKHEDRRNQFTQSTQSTQSTKSTTHRFKNKESRFLISEVLFLSEPLCS
jgi:hypothetical protein